MFEIVKLLVRFSYFGRDHAALQAFRRAAHQYLKLDKSTCVNISRETSLSLYKNLSSIFESATVGRSSKEYFSLAQATHSALTRRLPSSTPCSDMFAPRCLLSPQSTLGSFK